MEDLGGIIGGIIGGVFVIYIVVLIIGAILYFIYQIFIVASVYVILVADIIFGSVPGVPIHASWGISGFFSGALLYFAILEAPKLNRPEVTRVLVSVVIASFVILLIVRANYIYFNNKSSTYHGTLQNQTTYLQPKKNTQPNLTPQAETLYVNRPEINVHSGPGAEYLKVAKLQYGNQVIAMQSAVSSDGGNWRKVNFKGFEGWINKKLLRTNTNFFDNAIPSLNNTNMDYLTPQAETLYVNRPEINVRSGPGAEYQKVAKLQYRNRVIAMQSTVSSDGGNWRKVSFNGLDGWVNRKLLSTNPNIIDIEDKNTVVTAACNDGRLTSGQIFKLVNNKIAIGKRLDVRKPHSWMEIQRSDGYAEFIKDGKKISKGQWKIRDNQLCWCYGECNAYRCKYIEAKNNCSVWDYIDTESGKITGRVYKWDVLPQ